jgi:uncharacterized tellurite resistance protein B-like protein
MLIDAIKRLIGRGSSDADVGGESGAGPGSAEGTGGPDPLHLAACALLLEIAHADGEFSEDERAHLEEVLERHFRLPPSAGRRLIEAAEEERRSAIDHYGFTSVLKANYDLGQKMVLAEVMWGLVLADGVVAEHEQYLTRKIANLLDLKPGYLSEAKKNAAAAGEA